MCMLTVFAQRVGNNKRDDFPVEAVTIILGTLLVILLVQTIIKTFYLLTLSKALKQCDPERRTLEPGLLWLYLIPLVDLVWHFFIVSRMAESLKREFRRRGFRTRGDDFGQSLGTTTSALFACTFIPYLGSCFGLAAFVYWIIY